MALKLGGEHKAFLSCGYLQAYHLSLNQDVYWIESFQLVGQIQKYSIINTLSNPVVISRKKDYQGPPLIH